LAIDNERIYFSEASGDRFVLAQVSVKGGEVTTIPAPFTNNSVVMDISPDLSQLLVGSGESALWAVPLPAGSPHRLANITAQDGTWSPDGQHLLYANGHDLYLARPDGSEARKLLTAPGVPAFTRFSPDSRRIRFSLFDTSRGSLWEANVDGTRLHPLLPGWADPPTEENGVWTPDGAYYFFLHRDNSGSNVWVLPQRRSLFGKAVSPVRLTTGPLAFTCQIADRDGKRIFVIGSQKRGELVRYDSRSAQFVPFLSGIPAEEVDFSLDGQWVTYADIPDGTLWRSRVDGSERLQLTNGLRATLPRWSPDGKQIVFPSNRQLGKPWTLSLVSPQTGSVQELLSDKRDLMDPTWSRDSAQIAFTADIGEDTEIRIVNVHTHQVTTVPGSKHLFSPRWSPDGRYIAALSADFQKLLLFNFHTQTWNTWLDEGSTVGFPAWSRDSKYIYFHRFFGVEPSYRRVKFGKPKSEQLFDLKGLRRYFGGYGFWSGLAPDGTPLFVRDTSTEEIYALELQ
jgi:Tol biopolymer transport system component